MVRLSPSDTSGPRRMRSSSDRKLSWDVLLLAGWLAATFAIGLWVALELQDQGVNWIASIFLGAFAGVVLCWFFCYLTWHIFMRVTRGAPFRIGDRVVITDGPLKGEVGEVRKLCEGRCSVWVALVRDDDTSELHFFDWDQISRSDGTVGSRSDSSASSPPPATG